MSRLALFFTYFLLVHRLAFSNGKTEAEELLNAGLKFGQLQLEKHGEFYPYGTAMLRDKSIITVSSYDGNDYPSSKEVIIQLKKIYKTGASNEKYLATALFYNATVISPKTKKRTDAIAVLIDHKNNYSVKVFLPYKIENSIVVFSETFAEKGDYEIFKK